MLYQTEHWVSAYWEKRANGSTRCYRLSLKQDLGGKGCLRRQWQSLQSRQGRGMSQVCASREDGLQALYQEARRRARRQYRLMATVPEALRQALQSEIP